MESNKDILLRLDSKIDSIDEKVAKMQFDVALKFSNMQNANDKKFTRIENLLESDPSTNQMGAIEKIDKHEKRLSSLETKATAFGMAGGIIFVTLKWLVSIFV